MYHLAQYVALIHDLPTRLELTVELIQQSQNIQTEHELEIITEVQKYQFSDGTVIQKTLQSDNEKIEVEACIETWIEYRVIENPKTLIRPSSIHFTNHCREYHWIQYFQNHQQDD